MEWERYCEASPGERASASAPGGFCIVALARLGSKRASAQGSAARATPTHRDQPVATRRRAASHSRRDPVSCAASPLASLVGRAAGLQCVSSNNWSRHDQALRHPSTLCCIARLDDSLISRFLVAGIFLLGQLRCSEPHLLACFPGFSSSSAFLAPHPADSSISLTGPTSSSERLLLLRLGVAFQRFCSASGGLLRFRHKKPTRSETTTTKDESPEKKRRTTSNKAPYKHCNGRPQLPTQRGKYA